MTNVLCFREGTIKVGDRVLSINGIDTSQCSLMEAVGILRHARNTVKLTIEYDVSVMGTSYHVFAHNDNVADVRVVVHVLSNFL